MIIDCHVHENIHSFDSFLDFNEGIKKAKEIGLDGICITNHDNNKFREIYGDFATIDGIRVIVGCEVLTDHGDILVFGLEDIPEVGVSIDILLDMVDEAGGVAIAAHPHRDNNRGIEDRMANYLGRLDAVEGFNGNTILEQNLISYNMATELAYPIIGSSDAHKLSRLGVYATKFKVDINSYQDFIYAIKSGDFYPVEYIESQGYVDVREVLEFRERKTLEA